MSYAVVCNELRKRGLLFNLLEVVLKTGKRMSSGTYNYINSQSHVFKVIMVLVLIYSIVLVLVY